jgi:hypothetical protein
MSFPRTARVSSMGSPVCPPENRMLTEKRSVMKAAYRVLATLVALGIFVQAAAIAYAWFEVINRVEGGETVTSDSAFNAGHLIHGQVGMMVIPIIALALLVVSFFAKIPGGVKRAGLVLGLVVLQVLLAFVSFGAPVVGALHGANALAILGAAIATARLAADPASDRRPARATSAASV